MQTAPTQDGTLYTRSPKNVLCTVMCSSLAFAAPGCKSRSNSTKHTSTVESTADMAGLNTANEFLQNGQRTSNFEVQILLEDQKSKVYLLFDKPAVTVEVNCQNPSQKSVDDPHLSLVAGHNVGESIRSRKLTLNPNLAAKIANWCAKFKSVENYSRIPVTFTIANENIADVNWTTTS